MNQSPDSNDNILIASDKKSNAKLVKDLLDDDFSNIFTTSPNRATADFDQHRPSILLLVFETLEQSQSFYLGMFRSGGMVQLHPHRTIVLSNKNEVKRAYKLCREGIFDDYILFWPTNEDISRLSMSVYSALRELAAAAVNNSPTAADFAAQARRLATSENIWVEQITQGDARINSLEHDIARANNFASSAFEAFSQRLIQGDLREAIKDDNIAELQHQLGHLKRDTIEAPLQALTESVPPLKQWTNEFREASASHLESVRTLNSLANTIRPIVLVVDDDQFQHKIIESILKEENYRLLFASNSNEAFNILRKKQPDLILMDVMMPDIDGVEMVRRIKIVPHLDEIPILMITGKSHKTVIIKSLEAGAKDIIVKPFVRDTLLGKIKHTLMNR